MTDNIQRMTHDNYPTPEPVIDVIFNEIYPIALSGIYSWMEPAAGDMRIFNRLPEGNRGWAEIRKGHDYLAREHGTDIMITNPPFTLAQPFAEKMLAEARSVILLQRLNWMGSNARREFWQANPPSHLFVLSQRPAFAKYCRNKECKAALPLEYTGPCPYCQGTKITKGTDSAEYAWYCWDSIGILKRRPGIYVI